MIAPFHAMLADLDPGDAGWGDVIFVGIWAITRWFSPRTTATGRSSHADEVGVSAVAAVRRRDWRIAAALSIVPGAGELYNGQARKAVLLPWRRFASAPTVVLFTFGECLGRARGSPMDLPPGRALASVAIFLLDLLTTGLLLGERGGGRPLGARERVPARTPAELWFFHL